jgi:hypothetical protein
MNPRHFVVRVEVEGNSQVWFKREKRKEKDSILRMACATCVAASFLEFLEFKRFIRKVFHFFKKKKVFLWFFNFLK